MRMCRLLSITLNISAADSMVDDGTCGARPSFRFAPSKSSLHLNFQSAGCFDNGAAFPKIHMAALQGHKTFAAPNFKPQKSSLHPSKTECRLLFRPVASSQTAHAAHAFHFRQIRQHARQLVHLPHFQREAHAGFQAARLRVHRRHIHLVPCQAVRHIAQ